MLPLRLYDPPLLLLVQEIKCAKLKEIYNAYTLGFITNDKRVYTETEIRELSWACIYQ